MKISNNSKYFTKILFLFFIVLSSFYVYYLLNNDFNISEGFAEKTDCSDCKVKPSSGNCIPIYDISYKVVPGTNGLMLDNMTISYELTPLIFCEWQSSPTCISNNINNLPTLNERLDYSSSEIKNKQMQINNVTCCSGSTSSFYNDNSTTFNAVAKNNINTNVCSSLNNYLNSSFTNNRGINFDETNFINLQQLETNLNYRLVKSLCNDLSSNSYKPGLLFKKIDSSKNIFNVPNILPKDLMDFIMNSNFATKLPIVDPVSGLKIENNIEARNKINTHLQLFEYLDDQLRSRQASLGRIADYNDLTTLEKTNYTQAKTELNSIFKSYNIPSSNYLDISYNLLLKTANNNPSSYLLNPNQFFNCFGEVKQDNSGVFSIRDLNDLSNNDYFGTGTDSSYTAFGSNIITSYPSNNDLQMELKRLETLPLSGNAPVSVINTYLNAINSFYEKQIKNLTGPRDHVFNQELVFDNKTLETVTPTFFTYDDKPNNTYQCQESVTGNSIFKDCGPAAYVEFSRF
jgi:hypothetical protein